VLILYFVAIGLVVALIAGGRLHALEQVRFRWWGLALGGLAFQAVLFSDLLGSRMPDAVPALYVISTLVVLAALLRNLALPGFAVIAAGALLNLAAILANGGLMPSSAEARVSLNGTLGLGDRITNSTLAGADTLLPWLGDIFVLPRPMPFANAFSVGDLVIGAGIVLFLLRAMRPAGRTAAGMARGA
jgi:hypothetical protein